MRIDTAMILLIFPGIPIMLMCLAVRRRLLVKKHFDRTILKRGWFLPIPLPFVVIGVHKRSTYSATCRTCCETTPEGGATLLSLARHTKAHSPTSESQQKLRLIFLDPACTRTAVSRLQ